MTDSCHFPMFDGHWSSASEDIRHLLCHVASPKGVLEGSSNFMSGSSSWNITTLVGTVIVVVEI